MTNFNNTTIPNVLSVQSNATTSSNPFIYVFETRDPTTFDNQYPIQKPWLNTLENRLWLLKGFTSNSGVLSAIWIDQGSDQGIETITGDSGGPVSPDVNHNLNIVGTPGEIDVIGNPLSNTLTLSLAGGGTAVDSFITNISGPVIPNVSGEVLVNASSSTFTDGSVTNTLKTEIQGTNHALFIGRGANVAGTTLGAAINGQIPIGSTGVDPVLAVPAINNGNGNIGVGAGSLAINPYNCAKWIVSATQNVGTHTTITSAMAAASAGDTIFVRDGIYTENFIITPGVNLTSWDTAGFVPTCKIIGKITFSGGGSVAISGFELQTNSDFFFVLNGSDDSEAHFRDCYFNCINNTGMSFTNSNSASELHFSDCASNLGTTGIALWTSSSPGNIFTNSHIGGNTGNSITTSSNSSGIVNITGSFLGFPITCTGTGGIGIQSSTIDAGVQNATAFICNGTGPNTIRSSNIAGGTSEAIIIGAAASLFVEIAVLISSNTNVVSGTGNLFYGDITFAGGSSQFANTLTLNLLKSTPSNATSGNVWTSTGPNTSPTWQVAAASTPLTLAGNSGSAVASSDTINVVGSGSITTVASGSTLTSSLTGLTNHNLLIGAGTTTITPLAPSATSGIPLISQGVSSDPAFGTAVVAGGGTGLTSTTAYTVLCGGTTSTNPLQSIVSVGTANQVLMSNGAAALPSMQNLVSATPVTNPVVTINAGTGALSQAAGIITAPTDSHTASVAFGSISAGVAKQNTLGYDIQVNVSVAITAAAAATVSLGVGPTNTPIVDPLIAALSAATIISFSAIVPNNYYILVNTGGTITVGSITTQACPL